MIEPTGNENESFREFIYQLLALSRLRPVFLDRLTTPHCMKVYRQVFTHISIDPENNYEFFEILGDVTLNKSIVWYIKDRFPQLQNAQGVKVIARLRINLVSKKHFAHLADKLGFHRFIRATDEFHRQKSMCLLEDTFEAFFGATEWLCDHHLSPGSGYGICFRIIQTILDQEPMSLRYEDLYDPITRLKETFDYYRTQFVGRVCPYIWGTMKFETSRTDTNQYIVRLVQLHHHHPNSTSSSAVIVANHEKKDPRSHTRQVIGTTITPYVDDGKYEVCTQFLDFLEQKGFKRPIPDYYESLLLK